MICPPATGWPLVHWPAAFLGLTHWPADGLARAAAIDRPESTGRDASCRYLIPAAGRRPEQRISWRDWVNPVTFPIIPDPAFVDCNLFPITYFLLTSGIITGTFQSSPWPSVSVMSSSMRLISSASVIFSGFAILLSWALNKKLIYD